MKLIKIILITLACNAALALHASEEWSESKNLWTFEGQVSDPGKIIKYVHKIVPYNGRLYVHHDASNVPIISQDTREIIGFVGGSKGAFDGLIRSMTLLQRSAIGYFSQESKTHKIKLARNASEKDCTVGSINMSVDVLDSSDDESKIIMRGVQEGLWKIYIMDTVNNTMLATVTAPANTFLRATFSCDKQELWLREENHQANNVRLKVCSLSQIGKKPISELLLERNLPDGHKVSTLGGTKFHTIEFDALRNATLKIITASTQDGASVQQEQTVPIRHNKKHNWFIQKVTHGGKYVWLWEDNTDTVDDLIDYSIADTETGEIVQQIQADYVLKIMRAMAVDPLTGTIYIGRSEGGIDILGMRTNAN